MTDKWHVFGRYPARGTVKYLRCERESDEKDYVFHVDSVKILLLCGDQFVTRPEDKTVKGANINVWLKTDPDKDEDNNLTEVAPFVPDEERMSIADLMLEKRQRYLRIGKKMRKLMKELKKAKKTLQVAPRP